VHQVFHSLLKRDKVKCREMYRCNPYCISRDYWTNFRTILKNGAEEALFTILSLFWPPETSRGCQRATYFVSSGTERPFPVKLKLDKN